MWASGWIAAIVALVLWWMSTGAILVAVKRADRQGPRAGRLAVLWGVPFLLLGIVGASTATDLPAPLAAYVGFISALCLWGWVELTFLTGCVTGPNRQPARPGRRGWDRFLLAFGTVAWHELLLILTLAALVVEARNDGVPPTALWTFAVLFAARISAKLNLFLGVPEVNVEFLPRALAHLPSHFRIARANGFFPVSVIALSFAVAAFLERFVSTGQVDFALLAALSALALIEHWMMVLPVADAKLWRWLLPTAPQPQHTKPRIEDAHGL